MVRRFEITGGTQRTQIELGPARGDVSIKLTGGAKTIRLERPAWASARERYSLEVIGGSKSITIVERP